MRRLLLILFLLMVIPIIVLGQQIGSIETIDSSLKIEASPSLGSREQHFSLIAQDLHQANQRVVFCADRAKLLELVGKIYRDKSTSKKPIIVADCTGENEMIIVHNPAFTITVRSVANEILVRKIHYQFTDEQMLKFRGLIERTIKVLDN